VAARCKAWVCSPSFARIAVSNLAGEIDVYLLAALCVFRYRSLRRPSSRPVRAYRVGGVCVCVVCVCVCGVCVVCVCGVCVCVSLSVTRHNSILLRLQ
jgi:hypothetical protein